MGKVLKAAIAGYGNMGRVRRRVIEKDEHLELAGVYDVSSEVRKKTKDCHFFNSFEDLLNADIDIVFICAPNSASPELCVRSMQKGKHVFCEKPPGRTKEDVQIMIAAERANKNVKLKFGFNHRYHQPIIDAKLIIDKGRFGKIMWMRGVYGKSGANNYDNLWRNKKEFSGGGILIDQGIHMLDLFRLFCGEFDEIVGFIGNFYWPVDVEDNVFSLLRNPAGQVASLHSSATQWQHKFLLDIYLEKGYLSISGILSSTKTYGTETLKIARCVYDTDGYPLPNPEETISLYDEDLSWELEIKEFKNCILHDRPVEVGHSQDALKTMELIEKIYASDKKRGASPLAKRVNGK